MGLCHSREAGPELQASTPPAHLAPTSHPIPPDQARGPARPTHVLHFLGKA